jgi:nitroimidazol reductase NimA-like FMN-containing flavoprotein (pyridoxamine 5'-phosphate oxidase superfamily)
VVAPLGGTERTRLRRLPELAGCDVAQLHAILDEAVLAHVGIIDGDASVVLPCAFARDGDRLLLHGSTGSRLFRSLAEGGAACVTVTLLDGVVYARSLFHSSMNYRSAMVFGRGAALPDTEKLAALRVIAEHLMPGRWESARPPSRRELAATLVVAIPLEEASVKLSSGLPEEAPEDAGWPAWSGVVPLRLEAGTPESADSGSPPPDVLAAWPR